MPVDKSVYEELKRGFEKFETVREAIDNDKLLLLELMQILNDDQLAEFAENIRHNLDLGKLWV